MRVATAGLLWSRQLLRGGCPAELNVVLLVQNLLPLACRRILRGIYGREPHVRALGRCWRLPCLLRRARRGLAVPARPPRQRQHGRRARRALGGTRAAAEAVRLHHGGGDRVLFAYDLVDGHCFNRLLRFHQVQPPAHESIFREHFVRRLRTDDVHVVALAHVLEGAGDLHRVAEATELHLRLAADVAAQHRPRVYADADLELRDVELLLKLLVDQRQALLLCQGRTHSLLGMALHILGRVEEDQQSVTLDLGDNPIVAVDDASHHGEVPRQNPMQNLLRKRLRERGGVAQIREHDCDHPRLHIDAGADAATAHGAPHHLVGHELREGLDARGDPAEGFLQLPDLVDPRAPARPELLEGRVLVGKVQVREPAHQPAQGAQRPDHEVADEEAHSKREDSHAHGSSDAKPEPKSMILLLLLAVTIHFR
mmetsp:Transcript_56574/g.143372  ORF Transcript_56574/g.143372 Transcript_56574/m.143372 type:complete len:426 (+) Transcript_56574:520-1797(+)